MRYLIVIPAYNEADKIAFVVGGALKEVSDILVINDGSTDSTGEVIKGLSVKVLTQSRTGKGGALKAGFRYAVECSYDWVITMDADGQHDVRDIASFIKATESSNADVIMGSRMTDPAGMPFVRLYTNKIMSGIVSRLAGCRLSDTQCGFRAIRCRLLSEIKLETNNYDTESEFIIKAARRGFKINTTPIRTIYNGESSSINKFTDTIRFFKLVLRSIGNG